MPACEETQAAAGMMLAAAVSLAEAGLPVFPLKPGTKVPATIDGLKSATTDTAQIRSWWERWPTANVAIRTGAEAGVVVLDVDVAHGGAGTLAALEHEYGKLPRTGRVLTGGGGQHVYFRHLGAEVRNSAGKLGAGLDVRGDGGYVVAPPSVHESGRVYRWMRGLERGVADPPAWLLAESHTRVNGAAPKVEQAIPEGQRRQTMLSIAGSMRRRGLEAAEILAALTAVNESRCKPPLPQHELELVARDVHDRYPPGPAHAAREHRATPIDGIGMRSIEWLERPLWQRSAFQLLAGAKGVGKGSYLAGLAARISRAGENVVFVSTEDSVSIDLKPRLIAAAATTRRCFVIETHVRLPTDTAELARIADSLGGIGLLVIDPVANHIGATNSNSDAEVRDAIAPLNKLADELDCLIVGVRHPGKDRSHGALASILGSTAWVDTPRAVVMIAVDDEDPAVRVIQVVAGNRSLGGAAQAFRIDAVDVPTLTEPITLAVPLGESGKHVDDLLAFRTREESRSAAARKLLLDIVEEEGEQESDTLDARVARETGLAARTVKNARKELAHEGLIKPFPVKDEFGEIVQWMVTRSAAPRG